MKRFNWCIVSTTTVFTLALLLAEGLYFTFEWVNERVGLQKIVPFFFIRFVLPFFSFFFSQVASFVL
jgi:hypothetical protein